MVSVILTAQLTVDHDAADERRNPCQDDLGAADVIDLDSDPEMGTALKVIQRTGPRQAAMPGVRRGRADRRGLGRQGARGCGYPEHPSSCSGITLSDEGGQGERAHSRLCTEMNPPARPAGGARNGRFCHVGLSGDARRSSAARNRGARSR
jgi:hypothetical protein